MSTLTTTHGTADRDVAARCLYEAELAVHDAHQSGVDEWIRVATDRLHQAILRYEAVRTAA